MRVPRGACVFRAGEATASGYQTHWDWCSEGNPMTLDGRRHPSSPGRRGAGHRSAGAGTATGGGPGQASGWVGAGGSAMAPMTGQPRGASPRRHQGRWCRPVSPLRARDSAWGLQGGGAEGGPARGWLGPGPRLGTWRCQRARRGKSGEAPPRAAGLRVEAAARPHSGRIGASPLRGLVLFLDNSST